MEIIIGIVCFIIGGGVGFGVSKITDKEEPVVIEKIITESKVGEKLADIDLVKIPCAEEFIEKNGDLLCRELFCRMQQRGIDSKTSQVDCSGISNMNNSLKFIEVINKNCAITQESTDDYNKCFDRFNRILTTGKSGQ